MEKTIKEKVIDYLSQFYTEIKPFKGKEFKPKKSLSERYGTRLKNT